MLWGLLLTGLQSFETKSGIDSRSVRNEFGPTSDDLKRPTTKAPSPSIHPDQSHLSPEFVLSSDRIAGNGYSRQYFGIQSEPPPTPTIVKYLQPYSQRLIKQASNLSSCKIVPVNLQQRLQVYTPDSIALTIEQPSLVHGRLGISRNVERNFYYSSLLHDSLLYPMYIQAFFVRLTRQLSYASASASRIRLLPPKRRDGNK